eukprot:TRINITY_DN533_c0_g1_i2.p1 TRINITY_DN533_c0_g1~~TRINITY_DN533_c0_g1_i2.p1  ORF type:complete len:413 (-),score=74.32 TRINITY_DN533_c0_g1_i2:154-1323(-)
MAMLRFVAGLCTLVTCLGLNIVRPEVGSRWNMQTHASLMHGMTKAQQTITIKNVQALVANAPEGFASIVLMGDSTMSGIATELLNMTEEVDQAHELIYVSNDRAKKVRYGCNEACGGVPPGGEWQDDAKLTDDITKKTVERAAASTKALHDAGCKSGGGLETYVFRSGPFKNLVVHHWGFLPEYSGFCWKSCMADAMKALKPSVVLWNVGFHLLNHDFKPSICKVRSNPTKEGCSDHKGMIKTATEQMLEAGVGSVVWKSTNYLCEARQVVGFPTTKDALDKWHDKDNLKKLEEKCKSDCPEYNKAGLSCYDWFFDAHTTERFQKEALEAFTELQGNKALSGRVHMLDAFSDTKACCEAGCEAETDDGEHYAGLDSKLAAKFAAILGRV